MAMGGLAVLFRVFSTPILVLFRELLGRTNGPLGRSAATRGPILVTSRATAATFLGRSRLFRDRVVTTVETVVPEVVGPAKLIAVTVPETLGTAVTV